MLFNSADVFNPDKKLAMLNIRFAKADDNDRLIALTASSPMNGTISLRIDRKPDFFRLLNERGESKVLIAEFENEVAGCISVSRQKVYINGDIHELFYLGDFKIKELYRGTRISLLMIAVLKQYVTSLDADLFFCTAADGNHPVFPFFDGRLEIPPFQHAGTFNVFQLLAFKKKQVHDGFTILDKATNNELVTYLNNHFSKYQLGAVIEDNQLRKTINILIRDANGKLKGAMCLQDTLPWKQNIVVGLSSSMSFLLRCAKYLQPLIGMSALPQLGQPVRMLYAKYFVASDQKVARQLIDYGRNLVYQMNYSFLSLGMHSKDPLISYVKRFPRFTFQSHGMITSLKKNQVIINAIRNGVIFEDYSLV